jgi:hypothetical protein
MVSKVDKMHMRNNTENTKIGNKKENRICRTAKIPHVHKRMSRAQGSIEYIMMLSAVSIIIIVALAMMTQLKGAAVNSFFNGTGGNVAQQLASELSNLTKASR